jgi:hypothetical protein
MMPILENRMFERKILIAYASRALAVLLAAALAACAGTSTSSDSATPRPVAAGRGQIAALPPPPPPPPDPNGPPTLQKARAECWMSMETNKKAPKDPEKRLPLVEKCVQEKMNPPAPTAQAPQQPQ